MRTGTSSYCCNSNDDDEQEGNDCSMRDESGRKREREKEGMKTNMKRAVTSSLSRLSRLNQLVSSLSFSFFFPAKSIIIRCTIQSSPVQVSSRELEEKKQEEMR